MRARHVAAATLGVVASGCSASDLISLGREPSLGHVAFYLLVVPVLYIAKIVVEAVVTEAIGTLVGRLLPAWMKTRRALWTGVALMCLLTLAAVAYWNIAGRV